MYITNPVLRGFNPDPSIVRVGDDYYIATSTFEWYPGVQIHHSKDLVHWRLLTRPLRRASQLDMRGDPDSCGVWAPCLTYADGLFYLIYTDVKRYGRASGGGTANASLRDFHNYLVTAERIDGDWSEPIYLNSSGFDPSLFHDEDGRKYLLNMLWDHRPGQNRFAGIVLQEFSPREQKLIGRRRLIFRGTSIGFTEGPHLYHRGGYYHLLIAEGGTFWGHAVTMARSPTIDGPYEVHPDTYVLTARDRPDCVLQRAGHASLVDTQDGETYMVYLCGRPLPGRGRCVLGRETAIQKMVWSQDGWLRTDDGQGVPQVSVPGGPKTCRPTRSPLHRGSKRGQAPFAGTARRVLIKWGLTGLTPFLPFARISMRRSCPSIFSGCARPLPSGSGALPSGLASCASSAEKPWGATSSRRWSLAGSRLIVSPPRRAWNSSRSIFNRQPALSTITTQRNSITCC